MAFSLKKYNTFGLEVEATWGIEINDFAVKEKALKDVKYVLNTFKFKTKNTETKNEEDNLPFVTRNVTAETASSSEINL